jgi:hypothetical protein
VTLQDLEKAELTRNKTCIDVVLTRLDIILTLNTLFSAKWQMLIGIKFAFLTSLVVYKKKFIRDTCKPFNEIFLMFLYAIFFFQFHFFGGKDGHLFFNANALAVL